MESFAQHILVVNKTAPSETSPMDGARCINDVDFTSAPIRVAQVVRVMTRYAKTSASDVRFKFPV
jgi:hypothetical protein